GASTPTVPPAAVRILCPHCRRHLAVPEAHVGHPLRCGACSGTFRVPARAGAPPAPRADENEPPREKGAPAPLRANCPHCRQSLLLSRVHVGRTLKCPGCSGEFALRAGG